MREDLARWKQAHPGSKPEEAVAPLAKDEPTTPEPRQRKVASVPIPSLIHEYMVSLGRRGGSVRSEKKAACGQAERRPAHFNEKGGGSMTRSDLLKKLDVMFQEIERTHAWANVEIEFRDGVANMIRNTKNEKLLSQENTRGFRTENR